MKKIGLVLFLGVLLAGCSLKNEKSDSGEAKKKIENVATSKNKKKSEATNKQTKKVSSDKLYASVLEDYKELLNGITSNGSFSASEVYGAVSSMSIPIHDWVGTTIYENKESFRYAFYDVDGNGTDELLTSIQGASGEVSLLGVYYIMGETPKLLAEGYVGATSARAGIVIYKDGTILNSAWSSRDGKGVAELYALQKDNTEAKLLQSEKDIRISMDELNNKFGKTNDGVLKLESLEWEKVESSSITVVETTSLSTDEENVEATTTSSPSANVETKSPISTGMNVASIKSGDFSSIDGNWYSASGDSFTLSGGTFVSNRGSWAISNMGDVDGLASWSLEGVMVSAPIYVMVPAGQPIPSYTSDETKDRIYLRPQYMAPQEEFEQYIYYKE